MTTPTEAPDVEDAIKARLLDQLDASVYVVSEVTAATPRPVVEVAIVGGAPAREGIVESPLVSFTTYAGDDRDLARKLARDTRAALTSTAWSGAWTAGGFCATRGRTISDPVHHRDPNTREHKFSGTVQLVMRATG